MPALDASRFVSNSSLQVVLSPIVCAGIGKLDTTLVHIFVYFLHLLQLLYVQIALVGTWMSVSGS